jgi:multiple sugar transport system ATP-binding protein
MASVQLISINKSFGEVEVLRDINLVIEEGQFVVLVGPSGCGKSTTLRLVAGLDEITTGEVRIDDKVVNMVEPQHRNIAMVFQNYALYPHKNVRENIIFGLKRAKAPKELIDTRLLKAAKILQLEDLLDRKPAQLSGGQRQRVAMGRAIVRDADVFLFDEPLSNLDAKLRNQMRSEIRRIHREYKTTSIYVTHDQVEAMTLGDKVVVMRDGYIEQTGTPMEIYLNPINIFVATFIGAPAMNIVDAKLFSDHVQLAEHRFSLGSQKRPDPKALPSDGKPIKLGIRPDFFLDASLISHRDGLATIRSVMVDLIEPLGFDQEMDIVVGGQLLKARLDLRTVAREGGTMDLCFDMDRAHIFDPESGENLFR